MKTRFAKVLVLLTLVVAMVAMMAIPAMATEVTVLDGQVSITDNKNKNTVSDDGTVTIQAVGTNWLATTNTITIKNETSSKATLAFDYSVLSASEFKINDNTANTPGTYSGDLSAGGTVTVTLKAAKKTTATLTLSNFSLTPISGSANVTIQYDSTLGLVTVGGAAITSGTSQNVSLADGVALVATAKSGATFHGWINAADGAVISTASSYTLTPAADMTVKAVFIGANSAPHFMVSDAKITEPGWLDSNKVTYWNVNGAKYIFDDLNDAANYAAGSSNKYIVLINNSVLPAGTHTIPAGVTLVVPFDTANTVYTTTAQNIKAGDYDSTVNYKQPTAYRTLTMASGANLVINGTLSLPAKHRYANGGAANGGSPVGDVSFINMKEGSSITVNNGGALYAYGYIIGKGTVTAKNGANVYEYFQIMDFRGGNQTTGMDKDKGVFPLNQYYVQNIEVPLTLEYGAVENSYTTVYMSYMYYGSSAAFIGPKNAMFNLTSGSVTKWYDGSKDRLMVEVNGDMSIAPITMKVATSTLDSDEYVLPVNGNITVTAKSGTFSITQDVAFLPGAELIITETAQVTLGAGCDVYFYDADNWGTYCGAGNLKIIPITYAPSKTYTRTEKDLVDAVAIIDGYVDASQGYVYTTSGGAALISNGSGKVKTVAGTAAVTYQIIQAADVNNSTYPEIPITPAKLKNADGTYLETAKGGTTEEDVREYVYANGMWICNSDAHSYGEGVVTAPTCTENGYTTSTCTICGFVKQEITGDATGHQNIVTDAGQPATCTTNGLTEGAHCEDCGAVTTAQTEIPALGHTEETVAGYAATCTDTGLTDGKKCTVCQTMTVTQTEIPALGHKEETVVGYAATCTEEGLTDGKKCTVCQTMTVAQTAISAKGHTEVTDKGYAATCTVPGLTDGKHCSVCNTVIVAQKEISALGHTEVIDKGYAATCTAAGLTEGKHCSVCKAVLTAQEEISALGHTEVIDKGHAATLTTTGLTDGKHCSVCNEVLTAQEEIPALSSVNWNMTLADDLTVNLFVNVDSSIEETATISVTFNEETVEYKAENGACTLPVKVAAAQMADSIVLTITNGDDKLEKEYSVALYAKKILDDEEQKAYHALVQAMLSYGAAAQKYFGYNTDNIVSEAVSDAVIPESTTEMKVDVTNEKIRFYGASLVYREKIAVRFYFTGDAEGIVFTANGKEYTATKNNGLWCVEVGDIMPQELDQQITLTAENVEVSYGPMNYIWRMSQKDDTKLQNLMKALYNYHLAASKLGK